MCVYIQKTPCGIGLRLLLRKSFLVRACTAIKDTENVLEKTVCKKSLTSEKKCNTVKLDQHLVSITKVIQK